MSRMIPIAIVLCVAAAGVYAFQNPHARDQVNRALASVGVGERSVTLPAGTTLTARLSDRLGTSASRVGA